jgi:hypothetical protein
MSDTHREMENRFALAGSRSLAVIACCLVIAVLIVGFTVFRSTSESKVSNSHLSDANIEQFQSAAMDRSSQTTPGSVLSIDSADDSMQAAIPCTLFDDFGNCSQGISSRVIPGKFLAIVTRQDHQNRHAIVFRYESLDLITVLPSLAWTIPREDQQTAVRYSISGSGLSSQFQAPVRNPLGEIKTLKTGNHYVERRPIPYIIEGNVNVHFGPVIRDDNLTLELLLKDELIDKGRIDFVDSKVIRGPPWPVKFSSQRRKVYIIGNIVDLVGPEQYENSRLRAKISDVQSRTAYRAEIDLGPTAKEYKAYVSQLREGLDGPYSDYVTSKIFGQHFPSEDVPYLGVSRQGIPIERPGHTNDSHEYKPPALEYRRPPIEAVP